MPTYAERVRNACADREWQEFRKSLKGLPTQDKLDKLRSYWTLTGPGPDGEHVFGSDHGGGDCVICIQVDNYIKALCRGGQLYPGESLQTALDYNWQIEIRK